MKKNLLACLAVSAILISGCEKKEKVVVSGVSTEKYNKLVADYNQLTSNAYGLQMNSLEEIINIQKLDLKITQLNVAIALVENLNTPANVDELKRIYKETMQFITDLEKTLIDQYDHLMKNTSVLQNPQSQKEMIVELKENIMKRSQAMSGLRTLITKAVNDVITDSNSKLPIPKASSPSEKEIILTEEESKLVPIEGGQAFAKDQNGNVIHFKNKTDASNYANSIGIDPSAANDNFEISKNTNGILTFARSSNEISERALDIFAHIKHSINQNSDNLELVFAIDYSGSMSDDIENVISNLKKLVDSLQAVQNSGRLYKIGIVSFGKPTYEKVELQLTTDLLSVRNTLERMLNNFSTMKNSTDPGEASFHGLNLAASAINWSSINRKVILITDEPSYEISTGDRNYVENTYNKLAANSIQTSIYTIVVNY